MTPGVDTPFPPSFVQPGAVGDDEYSSLVVLPSGEVINAQIIANATGVHDRINEINIEERWANFQLLDGWEGGDQYYYHLVTDASDPGPAAIELGVYAPRMANLPTFGVSGLDPETVLLGFSPNINGLSATVDGETGTDRQGLGSTIIDADLDPVNVFPFDPDNSVEEGNNYSPMWDAHLNMWTDEAINGPAGDQRRAIVGFQDLFNLIDQGLVTSFSGNPGIPNDFINGLTATNAVINCPVICHPFQGEEIAAAPVQEARSIVELGAAEANRTIEDFNGSEREFPENYFNFLPSAIALDDLRNPHEANATLPIYEGVGPSGEPTYFIITEATSIALAAEYGAIVSPKLLYGNRANAAAAAQRVQVENGRIIFRGDVDFSPEVSVTPGSPNAFPPAAVQPGGVGDAEYSSLVVLPSGEVINAQIVANATGVHDRINEINIEERWANFQLLDGWEGGEQFYYHLVTDASDPGPAAIELGVYAPRMANLPTFGNSELEPETVLLGFSPNTNGLTTTLDGVTDNNRQGLGSTILDGGLDPVNIFPFDPDNTNEIGNNYSPMWDAHLNMWTDEAINGPNGDQRRAITSFADLFNLVDQGLVTSFFGSAGIENEFVGGLRASNAVINCPVICHPFQGEDIASVNAVGAVYAMTNGEGQVPGNVQGPNSVVAYAQAADGTLTMMGSFPTGGNGGDYDGGEGLDPLISAYALTKTIDNRFVLAVNAGSNTVTSMRVNEDFTLTVVDTESTQDIGPNSIAHAPSTEAGVNGLVYVSNITRPEFLDLGEPGHQGSIIGYRLMDNGSLEPIANSQRDLANRPSAIQFSPNGDWVVVASINSGAAGLSSGNEDEIVLYSVNADGTLSVDQTDGATSTLRDNADGRNLPSAIGFQITQDNIVVVTEAREFQPNGLPPAFPALQDGSVSTWRIMADGTFSPINLDVASGENNTGRTACWLDFSDENTFFVSNAIEAGLAAYSFDNGEIELVNQVAAQGTGATGNTTDPALAFSTTEGWIDLWISDDGQYLYQCYGLTGEIGVYAIDGRELTLVQEIGGLPQNNVQGIVSVGEVSDINSGSDGVDLVLDIQVDSRLYNIYEEVEYTITVTNNGDTEATNVIVDAGLPQGMVFTNSTVDAGNYELFFEEWTINSVAPGQTLTLYLTLFTLVENVDINNEVQIVGMDQNDSNPNNNFDSIMIVPFSNGGVANDNGLIDLELSLTAPSANFVQFEDVDFMLTLTNNGPDAATGIFIDAPIPQGFAFTSYLASAGDYNYFTQRWYLPELASGATATLRLRLFTLVNNVDLANAVQVFVADQNDSDSTPGNLVDNNAVEDDEAVLILNPSLASESSDGLALRSTDRKVSIEKIDLYPNPTNGSINFNFVSDAEYDAEIQIMDVIGRVIQSHSTVANRGVNNLQMDVSAIDAGIYFINLSNADGNVSNHKFIKID